MICSSVDLPQPEGPIIDTKLPRSMSRSMPFKATVVPPGASKDFLTPRTRSTISFCCPDGKSGRLEDAAGNIDRLFQKPVFLHHPHRVIQLIEADFGAKPRHQ